MKILKMISVFAIISTLFFCCSATNTKTMQKFQKNPPFKIISSEVTNWVGGQPGVRGIKVSIKVDNNDIKLDSLYFRNQKTALELVANSNPSEYIGIFITSSRDVNDFIIDKDATKEFGNKSKLVQEKIPFKLQDNEAVVSYQEQSKFFFYKIKNLK